MLARHTISNPIPLSVALAPLILIAQCALAQQAERQNLKPASCQSGPLPKNLGSPTKSPCDSRDIELHRPDKVELKKLASVNSREAHLKLAAYYRTEAERLEAEARNYENAAIFYRAAPKNLAAPTTAAQYQRRARELRDEARSDRLLASSYEGMSTPVAARAGNKHAKSGM